jgi:VanZ family protein
VENALRRDQFIYQGFGAVLRAVFRISVLGFLVLIVVNTLAPTVAGPSWSLSDKIVHFTAYFVLAFVSLPAVPKIKPLWVLLSLCALGIGLEIAQGVMGLGRTASFWDGVANASGAFFALFIWWSFSKIIRKYSSLPK